jgi:hypothetical protein
VATKIFQRTLNWHRHDSRASGTNVVYALAVAARRQRLRRKAYAPAALIKGYRRKNATAIIFDSSQRAIASGLINRGWGMTVYPLERNLVFEPEIIQVMAGAYEELLGALQLADRNDPFTEVVAKEVIDLARLGVRDAAEMRQRVLNTLGKSQ